MKQWAPRSLRCSQGSPVLGDGLLQEAQGEAVPSPAHPALPQGPSRNAAAMRTGMGGTGNRGMCARARARVCVCVCVCVSARQRHRGREQGEGRKSEGHEHSRLGTGGKGTREVFVVSLQPFPESDIHQSESWGQTVQGSGRQTPTAACSEARSPGTNSEAQPQGPSTWGPCDGQERRIDPLHLPPDPFPADWRARTGKTRGRRWLGHAASTPAPHDPQGHSGAPSTQPHTACWALRSPCPK